MLCENCGKQINDNFSFCEFCGAPQSKGNNSESPVSPFASTEPMVQPFQPFQSEPEPSYQPEEPVFRSEHVTPVFQSEPEEQPFYPLQPEEPAFQPEPTPAYQSEEPTFQPEPTPAYQPDGPTFQPEPTPAYQPEEPAFQPEPTPAYQPEEPIFQPEPTPAYQPEEPAFQPEPTPAYQPEESTFQPDPPKTDTFEFNPLVPPISSDNRDHTSQSFDLSPQNTPSKKSSKKSGKTLIIILIACLLAAIIAVVTILLISNCQPSAPTDPPVDTATPVEPADPVKPTEPVKPVEPVKPAQPIAIPYLSTSERPHSNDFLWVDTVRTSGFRSDATQVTNFEDYANGWKGLLVYNGNKELVNIKISGTPENVSATFDYYMVQLSNGTTQDKSTTSDTVFTGTANTDGQLLKLSSTGSMNVQNIYFYDNHEYGKGSVVLNDGTVAELWLVRP